MVSKSVKSKGHRTVSTSETYLEKRKECQKGWNLGMSKEHPKEHPKEYQLELTKASLSENRMGLTRGLLSVVTTALQLVHRLVQQSAMHSVSSLVVRKVST